MFSVRTFLIAWFVFVSNSLLFSFIYSRGAYFTWHIPIIQHYHLCKLQTLFDAGCLIIKWCEPNSVLIVAVIVLSIAVLFCVIFDFPLQNYSFILVDRYSMRLCIARWIVLHCFVFFGGTGKRFILNFYFVHFLNSLNGSVREYLENVQRREKLEVSFGVAFIEHFIFARPGRNFIDSICTLSIVSRSPP